MAAPKETVLNLSLLKAQRAQVEAKMKELVLKHNGITNQQSALAKQQQELLQEVLREQGSLRTYDELIARHEEPDKEHKDGDS